MPPWITSYFLNPAYVLPGAALIAAPIIIHFINRLRFRRVKWAAMEFLLASQQRNRRRLLLEQLLLLLLRVAVVLAIVALIARPLLNPDQLSLFQGQKTHHLVLLDDSGSMSDHWAETSAFDGARDVVRKIATEGARRPGTQMLTLVLTSRPQQPLFTLRTLDPQFLTELDSKIDSLAVTHRTLDLPASVEASRQLLLAHPGSLRNFHLISDFRRHDWGEDSALATAVRELGASRIGVNLIRTVPARHENLGVTELSGSVDVAAVNVPLRLKVSIRNYSDQVARNTRMTVLVDGRKLPASVVIDNLEAGKETSREFDVVFPRTGPHEVRVVLPADSLEQDNTRILALQIPESNPVLVIDGTPSQSSALYLVDALAPAPGITGFTPTIESADYLRRHPLDRYQAIYLLNVAELHPEALRAVSGYVNAGGGLAWFLGDQIRPAWYNDKLYKEGQGLFPAKLESVAELPPEDSEENPAPDLVFEPHPVFRVFEGQENPFIDGVKVSRYFSVPQDWKAPEGVRVIATLRNGAPLFLEHRFGKGTILTSLTTCGADWNNWPRNPSYVVMQLELEKRIARSERLLDLRVVGEPIRLALDVATYAPQVEIQLPDGTSERLTAVISETPSSGTNEGLPPAAGAPAVGDGSEPRPQFVDQFSRTDDPGVYVVVQKRLDGGDDTKRFAYNVPASESELELAANDDIKMHVGNNVPLQIQEVGNFDWLHGEQAGQEIHDFVLIVLLLLLLGEQLLSLRLSYHPKPVGARA